MVRPVLGFGVARLVCEKTKRHENKKKSLADSRCSWKLTRYLPGHFFSQTIPLLSSRQGDSLNCFGLICLILHLACFRVVIFRNCPSLPCFDSLVIIFRSFAHYLICYDMKRVNHGLKQNSNQFDVCSISWTILFPTFFSSFRFVAFSLRWIIGWGSGH